MATVSSRHLPCVHGKAGRGAQWSKAGAHTGGTAGAHTGAMHWSDTLERPTGATHWSDTLEQACSHCVGLCPPSFNFLLACCIWVYDDVVCGGMLTYNAYTCNEYAHEGNASKHAQAR